MSNVIDTWRGYCGRGPNWKDRQAESIVDRMPSC